MGNPRDKFRMGVEYNHYIGVTLHPCDYVRTPFISGEPGFDFVKYVDYLYGNSRRGIFVVRYAGFVKKILSSNKSRIRPIITINGVGIKKAPALPFLRAGK
jgi:hypothetical protein